MNTEGINLNALNFSPHFWWKYIERAIYLTDSFGQELISGFSFRNWLLDDYIEHTSLNLYDENLDGRIVTPEFRNMVTNDYYHEVIAINNYGNKVKAKTIEELYSIHSIPDNTELSYNFKVEDLNHFATLYFMKWLIMPTQFNFVRWQLYYDFIVSKLNEDHAELYHFMWASLLGEVNFNHKFFDSVEQYKKFRDRLDDINKKSDDLELKISQLRNNK